MSSLRTTPRASAVIPAAGNGSSEKQCKRAYKPPRLTELGELLDVTMGPSPGLGESGNPAVFRSSTRSR